MTSRSYDSGYGRSSRALDPPATATHPEDQRVRSLRERRENQWFDRKSPRIRPRELADVIIGFANAEGGLIAIGIDNGRINGIGNDDGRENAWRQASRDFSSPPVPIHFERIPCITDDGYADHLLIVEVEASEHVHENVRGEIYLRIGDENRRLGPLESQELRYDKGGTFFDGSDVRGATRQDLDERAVAAFLRAVGGTNRPEDALISRGLMTRGRGGRPVPTVAGILTLGRDPQQYLPGARLRVLRYQGTSRETGERSNIVTDVEAGGTVRDQILFARRVLRRWLGAAVRLGRGGRFRPTSLVPEDAWLEAVVNAVVHRSYSIGGDHTRVSLFANRLEVESPGRCLDS